MYWYDAGRQVLQRKESSPAEHLAQAYAWKTLSRRSSFMRVLMVHGGLWDGWCVVELASGERRLVRSITDQDFEHIARSAILRDVTRSPGVSGAPLAGRPPQRRPPRDLRPRRPDWLEIV
jgi:hypothetical protein